MPLSFDILVQVFLVSILYPGSLHSRPLPPFGRKESRIPGEGEKA